MDIKVNVKRKFKVNGKEYNSIEEMPRDIRDAFEKAIASQGGPGYQVNAGAMQTKIIFNDKEYKNIDEMPQDVRLLYEKVLKSAETETVSPDIVTSGDINSMLTGFKTHGSTRMGNMGFPTKTEPVFSMRTLIISIGLIALMLLLYYVFEGK